MFGMVAICFQGPYLPVKNYRCYFLIIDPIGSELELLNYFKRFQPSCGRAQMSSLYGGTPVYNPSPAGDQVKYKIRIETKRLYE